MKMESSIENTIKDSDCIMVLCGHDEFLKYPLENMKRLTKEPCIFLDGRNCFERNVVEKHGFVYQGIGK